MSLGQPLPVLMYHHISPKPGLVTCSPDNFRAHMQWLVENGWKTLSTDAFTQILAIVEGDQHAFLRHLAGCQNLREFVGGKFLTATISK
jgi:hypothetical protein